MAKKQASAKAAVKDSASPNDRPAVAAPANVTVGEMMRATMPEAPKPEAVTSGVPTNVAELMRGAAKPNRQRFEPPTGWVKLPMELRSFWSPERSTRPLLGILFAQTRLEVEQIPVLAFKLTAETDVVLPNGKMGVAKAGQEVLVPQFYALGAVAQLLNRQDLYYHVFIGNAVKADLGSSDEGTLLTTWDLEVRVNQQGIPRPQPQQPQG